MHHYSSQKSNFVDFQPNPRRKVADMNRELLIQMLKRENEIRLSNPVQEMYDEERILKIIPSTSIEEAIQKLVLEEFGFEHDLLDYYRCTRARFPNDPEIRDSVLYIKHDKSRRGDLRVGHNTPNPTLITLNNEERCLLDFKIDKRPLVLIAGSYS